jgi:hypothetical protein
MEKYAAAWAAGFFDGEGWVGVTNGVGTQPRLLARVDQVDARPLHRLYGHWGGRINNLRRAEGNRRQIWIWAISGEDCLSFLQDIRPFSIVKRDQIDAVFASGWITGNPPRPIGDEQRTLRLNLRQRLVEIRASL